MFGASPIFLKNQTDLVLELFSNSDSVMHSCEFGAEQAILVRDEESKTALKKVNCK